jgi:hypothetical protein
VSWRHKQRRIRQARDMAGKLGLRLSNLRSVDNTHADLWVLAVPRSFDDVEAELLERMRQREHFQDHTYTRAYPPVWTDMEYIENGDGESVPVQYISVNTCRQCGAMVHDQLAHNSWHSWMLSLREWMGKHQHNQVTPAQPASRPRNPRRHCERPGAFPELIDRIDDYASEEATLARREQAREALETLGPNTSLPQLAQHLHIDVWEVRTHLQALAGAGSSDARQVIEHDDKKGNQ